MKTIKFCIIYLFNILILISFVFLKPTFGVEDPLGIEKSALLYNGSIYDKGCEALNFSDSVKTLNIFYAVNIALCKNPETKAYFFEIKQNAADYGIAISAYLPSANINGYHNESRTDPSDIKNKTTGAEISYEWLLFDFGKREANKDKAYFLLLHSVCRHNVAIQNLIYSTIEAYCNFFASKKEIEAAIRSQKAYKTAYEIAKEKYHLGIVPKIDILQAKTDYAKSVLTLKKAENKNADYLGQLLKLLNIKQGTRINLEKPEIINDLLISEETIDALIEKGLKNRADIKSVKALKKSYEAAEQSAKYSKFPSISLYGQADIKNSNSQSETIKTNGIGIRASFPLFTGYYNTYSHKKAEYIEKTAELEKEKTENNAAYEVWTAYNNLKITEESFKASETMLDSASENKNLTFGMYKAGQSNILDLLKAIASYADAEKEMIISEYNGIIARALLLKSIGELDGIATK